jgi:hypothetical protein
LVQQVLWSQALPKLPPVQVLKRVSRRVSLLLQAAWQPAQRSRGQALVLSRQVLQQLARRFEQMQAQSLWTTQHS